MKKNLQSHIQSSRVHISSESLLFPDSEETIHIAEKMMPHMKAEVVSIGNNGILLPKLF